MTVTRKPQPKKAPTATSVDDLIGRGGSIPTERPQQAKSRRVTQLRLPEDLAALVDRLLEPHGASRNAWIIRACEEQFASAVENRTRALAERKGLKLEHVVCGDITRGDITGGQETRSWVLDVAVSGGQSYAVRLSPGLPLDQQIIEALEAVSKLQEVS